MTRRYPKSQARRKKNPDAVALGKLGRGKTSKRKKQTSAENAVKARAILLAMRTSPKASS